MIICLSHLPHTMANSAKIEQFIAVTGVSEDQAKFYLDSSSGDLETAVEQFYATGGAQDVPAASDNEAMEELSPESHAGNSDDSVLLAPAVCTMIALRCPCWKNHACSLHKAIRPPQKYSYRPRSAHQHPPFCMQGCQTPQSQPSSLLNRPLPQPALAPAALHQQHPVQVGGFTSDITWKSVKSKGSAALAR